MSVSDHSSNLIGDELCPRGWRTQYIEGLAVLQVLEQHHLGALRERFERR